MADPKHGGSTCDLFTDKKGNYDFRKYENTG